MSEMKQWRCGKGHILGFVRWDGNGVAQLMVLREALDMDALHPNEVDLMGPLDGSMSIPCSICGDVKPWVISVDGLVKLFQRMDGAKVLEFSQRLLKSAGSD